MADKYNLGTVGGITVTELFSGSVGNITGAGAAKITLNDDLTNYKFLIFDMYCSFSTGGANRRYYSRVISVQQFINLINKGNASTTISITWGYSNLNDYFDIKHDSTTTKVLNFSSNFTQCLRIVGIN